MSLEQICAPASATKKGWMKINCQELTVNGVSIPQVIPPPPSSVQAYYSAPSITDSLPGPMTGNMKLTNGGYVGFTYVNQETLRCDVAGIYSLSTVLQIVGKITGPAPQDSFLEIDFRCVNITNSQRVRSGGISIGGSITVPLTGLINLAVNDEIQFPYVFLSALNIGNVEILGSTSNYPSQVCIVKVFDNPALLEEAQHNISILSEEEEKRE